MASKTHSKQISLHCYEGESLATLQNSKKLSKKLAAKVAAKFAEQTLRRVIFHLHTP
jgi:hypothetical protein